MLSANTVRRVFPGNKIGKIQAWFVLHRGMMVSAILCTIAAFITIFVAIGGWSDSAGSHAILGCIVVGCMTINPIMAVFRPNPGTLLISEIF